LFFLHYIDSLAGILNQFLIPKLCDCKIKSGKFYKRNEDGCDICKNNLKKGYHGLNVVGEIVELKLDIDNFKKENWVDYISINDNLNYLLKNGFIDREIFNFYKTKFFKKN